MGGVADKTALGRGSNGLAAALSAPSAARRHLSLTIAGTLSKKFKLPRYPVVGVSG